MASVGEYLQEQQLSLNGAPHRVDESPSEDFLKRIYQFLGAASSWLAAEPSSTPMQKVVLELYFTALAFVGIAELYDDRYITILEAEGTDLTYTLFCLDPSEITRKRLALAQASVLFSATLTPLAYYRDILGGADGDYLLSLPSPFDQKRLLLCTHGGISTKYTQRADSIAPIAETIAETVCCHRGNHIVYFPSYAYMRQVYEEFTDRFPTIATIRQESAMDENAREDFLKQFDAARTETLVGFCILGGIFSEGIDLKGERLIGSIVVGVGLPGIDLRTDLIRDYYDIQRGTGFDYAYVFPGMNKVLQAAGRVIRSEEDRGIVLLIDSRFATGRYRALYPAHWSGMRYIRETPELIALLRHFNAAKGQLESS